MGKAPSSDHWKEGTREDSGAQSGIPGKYPCPAMTKDGMEEKMPQDTRRNPFLTGPAPSMTEAWETETDQEKHKPDGEREEGAAFL